MDMNLKKTGWIVLGLVGLSLGAAGAVLPMLPCVPFLLLVAVGFSKGSRKLHEWFVHTKLYKENLEDYVAGRGMTWKTKIRIMIVTTLLMMVGFLMMGAKGILVGCVVLVGIWILHLAYFCFFVKTI